MNPYVEKLKSYLMEQPVDYGYDNASSLLEMLYYYYTEVNPIDNAAIRSRYKDLDEILARLTVAENDKVFDLVCSLCSEHERLAFLEGVHVGTRLVTELSEPTVST